MVEILYVETYHPFVSIYILDHVEPQPLQLSTPTFPKPTRALDTQTTIYFNSRPTEPFPAGLGRKQNFKRERFLIQWSLMEWSDCRLVGMVETASQRRGCHKASERCAVKAGARWQLNGLARLATPLRVTGAGM